MKHADQVLRRRDSRQPAGDPAAPPGDLGAGRPVPGPGRGPAQAPGPGAQRPAPRDLGAPPGAAGRLPAQAGGAAGRHQAQPGPPGGRGGRRSCGPCSRSSRATAGRWSRWWAIPSGPGGPPWRTPGSSPWRPTGSAPTPSCTAGGSSSTPGTTLPPGSGSTAACTPCSPCPWRDPDGAEGWIRYPAFLYTGFALVMPSFVSYAQGWEVMQPERLPKQARAWKVVGDYQISPIALTELPNPPESQRLVARPPSKGRKTKPSGGGS